MLEQLSIFDELPTDQPAVHIKPSEDQYNTPYIGQKAKLKLPTNKDCEVYQYMYYYCSHLMKRAGEVIAVKTNSENKIICTIDFHGDIRYFHLENIILL